MKGRKTECARGSTEMLTGTATRIDCEVVAFGGGGGTGAVAESAVVVTNALGGCEIFTAGDAVGSGAAGAEGEAVLEGSGDGLAESGAASTVPISGLNRSTASDRGVIAKRERRTRPRIAFLIVDFGRALMLERVMKLRLNDFFHRVLPVQSTNEG